MRRSLGAVHQPSVELTRAPLAATLAAVSGLDAVDTGGLTMARCLEGFVFVYVGLARSMGRRIGFRLLRD